MHDCLRFARKDKWRVLAVEDNYHQSDHESPATVVYVSFGCLVVASADSGSMDNHIRFARVALRARMAKLSPGSLEPPMNFFVQSNRAASMTKLSLDVLLTARGLRNCLRYFQRATRDDWA